MQLYAHNWMFKIKVIIGNMQGKSESREVRKSESPKEASIFQLYNIQTFQPFNNCGRKSGSPNETPTLQPFNFTTFQQIQQLKFLSFDFKQSIQTDEISIL
jgi:hypothetical protein